MKTWLAGVLLGLGLFFAMTSPRSLQAADVPGGTPQIKAERGFRVESDVENGPGAFSLTQSKVNLCYYILYFHYDRRSYDWTNLEGLPFGNGRDEPWHNLDQLTLNLQYGANINDRASYFFSLGVSESFEKWAHRLHDYNYIGGVQFKLNASSRGLLGFAAWDNEVKSFIIPILGYQWKRKAGPEGEAGAFRPWSAIPGRT